MPINFLAKLGFAGRYLGNHIAYYIRKGLRAIDIIRSIREVFTELRPVEIARDIRRIRRAIDLWDRMRYIRRDRRIPERYFLPSNVRADYKYVTVWEVRYFDYKTEEEKRAWVTLQAPELLTRGEWEEMAKECVGGYPWFLPEYIEIRAIIPREAYISKYYA